MGSNCMASASIGCLFCCQGCNAEKLRNAFTFLPPAPSYAVDEAPPKDAIASAAQSLTLGGGRLVYLSESLRNFSFYQQATEHADVRFLRTNHGERIPVVWVRRGTSSSANSPPPAEQQAPLVLLHCHGNATDIGMMMGPYLEFTKQLGIEVVGVEYTGYGMSTGTPSSRTTYTDIEAAYKYVVASGVPAERVVAYGQSVGSGPVVGLAAKFPLGGLILHSPMMSGIKVIDPEPDRCCRPSCCFKCFDFFPNDQRMRSMPCPAFVIHGQVDDIIPYYHGHRLSEMTPKQNRWPGYFPRGAGHNDIVELNSAAYFGEVGAFLRSVDLRSRGEEVKMPDVALGASCKPVQQVMHEPGDPAGGDSNTALPYHEPAVGPEDGRYNNLRYGKSAPKGVAPGAATGCADGNARELRTAQAQS